MTRRQLFATALAPLVPLPKVLNRPYLNLPLTLSPGPIGLEGPGPGPPGPIGPTGTQGDIGPRGPYGMVRDWPNVFILGGGGSGKCYYAPNRSAKILS